MIISTVIIASAALAHDYTAHGANWQTGVCLSDRSQSPVALPPWPASAHCENGLELRVPEDSKPFALHYSALGIRATAEDFGVSLVLRANTCASSTAGTGNPGRNRDEEYVMQGFHFHSRSEHTHATGLAQRATAGEVHFVFSGKNAKDDLVVVGLMLDESTNMESPLLQSLLNATLSGAADARVDWQKTELFRSAIYHTYSGSLTTPPCTRPVRWFVGLAPISGAQSRWLQVLRQPEGGGNYREVQPLNERPIMTIRMTPRLQPVRAGGSSVARARFWTLLAIGVLLFIYTSIPYRTAK